MYSVKLYDLMSMTAGIKPADEDALYNSYPSDDQVTPEALLAHSLGISLYTLPGRAFRYSNYSVALAGFITARHAGPDAATLNQRYSALLEREVLRPLGMNNSTIFVSKARASGNFSYSYRGGKNPVATTDYDQDAFSPAGSLKSSANDMARYLYPFIKRGKSLNGERMFRKKSLRTLWRPTGISGSDGYAAGWEQKRYQNVRVIMHEGAFDDFTSVIGVLPKQKIAYVILANTERVGTLLSQAHEVLINSLK